MCPYTRNKESNRLGNKTEEHNPKVQPTYQAGTISPGHPQTTHTQYQVETLCLLPSCVHARQLNSLSPKPGRTSPAAPHQQPSWPAPAPHCPLFPFEGPLPGPRLLCTVAWSHASCDDTLLLFWQAPQAGLPLHLVPGRRLPCFSLNHPALTAVLPSCYKE